MAGLELTDNRLPHSLDAEQAVLGAILVDSATMSAVASRLHPESFYVTLHNNLYSVIYQMHINGQQIDIVTVMENSVRQGVFETPEDARAYLVKLAESAISPSSIDSYIDIIDDKSMVRELMTASKDIFDLASAGTEETSSLLDFAEKKIFDIRGEKNIKGLTHIRPIVMGEFDQLMKLCENPGDSSVKGMHTGFPSLDKKIFGLNNSDLIVIAARPGMGKTTLATNMAVNVAKSYRDKCICMFSLEMSKEQIVDRILNAEARITSDQMRTGTIPADKWGDISESVDILSKLGIYIDDTASISIGEMKAKLRRVKNLGLVIVDYLQLMTSGRKEMNRVNEVSDITRSLKIMAKDLNVPVITMSQLARGPEQREDKRPLLSDLRESGSIEQDADIVLFIYRDGYYNKETQYPNLCECIIAKNRHGETGKVNMNWEGAFYRFSEVVYRDER